MDKTDFAALVIVIVAVMQIFAWVFGMNGQVFAFTSLIIGGIIGSVFGFSIKKTS